MQRVRAEHQATAGAGSNKPASTRAAGAAPGVSVFEAIKANDIEVRSFG
jgi:hypothetical protein